MIILKQFIYIIIFIDLFIHSFICTLLSWQQPQLRYCIMSFIEVFFYGLTAIHENFPIDIVT